MIGIGESGVANDLPDLCEVAEGLLVRQGQDAYIARNWRLTPTVLELIDVAAEAGLYSGLCRSMKLKNLLSCDIVPL